MRLLQPNYCFSLISCFFLFCQIGIGQTIIKSPLNKNISIKNGIYYLEDPNNSIGIREILTSQKFKKVETDIPNFGTSTSSFWIKLNLLNLTKEEEYLLEIAQPGLDEVHFYYYNDKTQKMHYSTSGEYLPFYKREVLTPNYIFHLEIPQNKEKSVYIKIRSKDFLQTPLLLGTKKSYFHSLQTKNILFGLYVGFMLVMLLYNTFLYINIKDKNYFFYIIYLAAVIITQTSILGYTFQYLWPNYPLIAQYSSFIHGPFVGITSLIFTRHFLKTKEFYPKLDKGLNFFIAGYILAIALALFGFFKESFNIINSFAGILSLYMLILAFLISKKYKPARFFLIAWSAFLIGVTLFVLSNTGILSYNNFTLYLMPFGSAVEVVLLSFALADNMNTLKREKEESQLEVFKALQENEKLIKEQNIMLEQKVVERTQELHTTNKELHTTLKDLKDAQAQLVDAEKMASLGQLTAGIAHEINNPINFVSGNVKPLQLDIDDILSLIQKYETIIPNENIEQQLKEIDKYKNKIDLKYIQEEIKTLLHGISDGASRTAEIVKGLRNFSRLDEGDIKTANLNEGIESTLTILRSAIPNNINVVLNLGDIPLIECYAGKLNQVFMNAINNAVHAMQKNKTIPKHTLTISTYEFNHSVCVSIEDTGIGMSEEVKQKMFEPFFTTKDVGEGTGLGMSIVFKIIETHRGKIDVESEINKGTKITFTLPKKIAIS